MSTVSAHTMHVLCSFLCTWYQYMFCVCTYMCVCANTLTFSNIAHIKDPNSRNAFVNHPSSHASISIARRIIYSRMFTFRVKQLDSKINLVAFERIVFPSDKNVWSLDLHSMSWPRPFEIQLLFNGDNTFSIIIIHHIVTFFLDIWKC